MGLSLKKNPVSPNADKLEARERLDEYRRQLRKTNPEDLVLADETAAVQVYSRLRTRGSASLSRPFSTRRRKTLVAAMGTGRGWPPGCLTDEPGTVR